MQNSIDCKAHEDRVTAIVREDRTIIDAMLGLTDNEFHFIMLKVDTTPNKREHMKSMLIKMKKIDK